MDPMRPSVALVLALLGSIGCSHAERASSKDASLREDGGDGVLRLDGGGHADVGAGPDAAPLADAAIDADAQSSGDAMPAPDAALSPDASASDAAPLPPVRPVGANLPNLLGAYIGLSPETPDQMRAEMDHARAAGITHARFIASGFWPINMSTGSGWVANPTAFFAGFDQMMADARARGLRVVPSLLWNTYLFPDLAHEPVGNLFTPGTATRMLAERYITQVVTRYKDDDAILFWEIGNELNLLADLDVSTCNVCSGSNNPCGGLAPSLGTPCQRTMADEIYSCNSCRGVSSAQQDLGEFVQAIATLIKSIDIRHGVSSGFGYPRSNAMHLARSPCPSCDWTLDSPADYAQAIANTHPAAIDYVSVHHYFGTDAARFGATDQAGIDLLQRTKTIATMLNKQVYVGEWGEPRAGSVSCGGQLEDCGGDPFQVMTHRLLDAFVASSIPYSAVWTWEFYQFCPASPTCLTLTPTEAISASLDLHNQAYGACAGSTDGTRCAIGACAGSACTPISMTRFAFDASGDESAWIHWTNCSACTPGQWTRVTDTSGNGTAQLVSFDLPCTGSCAYPGAYALSPPIMLPPEAQTAGNVLMYLVARASSAGNVLRLIPYDAQGRESPHIVASAKVGTDFSPAGLFGALPAGTASVRLRLEVLDPNAKLEVDDISFEWE
jgi:hypothetical protein